MKQNTPLFLTLLFFLFQSCGDDQAPLTLEKGSIVNEVHQNNIGKIAFMTDWVPLKSFTNNDFKKALSISETSELGFRMFLGHTLTYYLSELAPDLSVNELCDKGNFQLTFYVDEKEIYQYNLQTGAGSCDYKNSATVYGIPFKNKKELDHWGIYLWTKFMKLGGGQDALSLGNHAFKLEIRPYLEHQGLKVGDIIAQGAVELSVYEETVDETLMEIQAIAPTDRFEIDESPYNKAKIRQLNAKIAQQHFKKVTSIVILKDGKLVLEEYFNGADRTTLHDTRSVGKSLTSSIMGIAIEEGHLKSENAILKDFYTLANYQHPSPEKEQVSLKSLLTMSSGFGGTDMDPDSPGHEDKMYPTNDWVKFGLDLPMDPNKVSGESWDYFTAGIVLLGEVLERTLPKGLEQYAEEKLFRPLGIKEYQWKYTPKNTPNTAGGFQMSSLDNARYGQLYLDRGNYQGRSVLPEKWVASSLSKQVVISEEEERYYGYLFWNRNYKIDDKTYEMYYASGNGGNRIMIFKDLGIVMVITARAYGTAYMHLQADEIVEKYLLPALLSTAD
ncbi:MAG: serine hydrolase [Bacteroidota bacterium]